MQKILECKKFLGFGFVACVILIPLMIEGISAESDKFALFLATYLVALLGLWKDKNKLFTIIGLFLWGLLCLWEDTNLFLWSMFIFCPAILLLYLFYPIALIGLLFKRKLYRLPSQIYFCIFGCIVLIW